MCNENGEYPWQTPWGGPILYFLRTSISISVCRDLHLKIFPGKLDDDWLQLNVKWKTSNPHSSHIACSARRTKYARVVRQSPTVFSRSGMLLEIRPAARRQQLHQESSSLQASPSPPRLCGDVQVTAVHPAWWRSARTGALRENAIHRSKCFCHRITRTASAIRPRGKALSKWDPLPR